MAEERIFEIIRKMDSDERLSRLETNIRAQGQLTEDVERALKVQYAVIGRNLVAERTGLDLSALTQAEEKIVQAVYALKIAVCIVRSCPKFVVLGPEGRPPSPRRS